MLCIIDSPTERAGQVILTDIVSHPQIC